jgi:hypothetical protein
MSAVIILINGATFFASVPKFTKGVGQAIRRSFAERKRERIQRNLSELVSFRNEVQRHRGECERLSLKRREKRSRIREKFYQDSVSAARNQLYAARIECMERWKFLRHHKALPMNMVTEQQWDDFDEYLKEVERVEEAREVYA